MKNLFTLLLISFLFSSSALRADPVDSTQALATAQRFYYTKSKLPQARQATLSFQLDDKKPFHISNANARLGAAEFLYYVFNVGNNDGFVIISGDDAAHPVIGYSTTGHFETKNQPEHVFKWMWNYERQLQDIKDARLKPTTEITQAWQDIKIENRSARKSELASVAPLLKTTWDQSPRYNAECPYDGNKLSVTGCVATAMAQIMKFHNHPSAGSGFNSYDHLRLGNIYESFDTDYEWSSMPNELSLFSTSGQINSVAKLMRHCGVSISMNYSSDQSSANTADVSAWTKLINRKFESFEVDEQLSTHRHQSQLNGIR